MSKLYWLRLLSIYLQKSFPIGVEYLRVRLILVHVDSMQSTALGLYEDF